MKFCNKCGHEMREDAAFCPECGNKGEQAEQDIHTAGQYDESADHEYDVPHHDHHPNQESQVQDRSRPPMSATAKILLAFAAVLVLALTGGIYAGSQIFSPDRTIQAFQDAARAGDTDKLAALLRPELSAMDSSREDIERLAKYLKENQAELDEVIQSLRVQAAEGESDPDAVLTLKKDGRRLLLFNHYIIQAAPYYMTVHTNMENTQLLIDGELSDTAQSADYSQKFGPFWPGEHEVKAVYAGEFVDLEETQQIILFAEEQNEVTLEIDAGYVAVDSEYKAAEVYVNGEPTGMKVGDIDGEIGPVTFNGQVSLHAEMEFPWGRYKSEQYVLTEDHREKSIAFTFEEAAVDAREEVMNSVNEFLASWVPAYENMDINQFTNITEERKSLFASDFNWMIEYGQRFTAKIVGTEFDLDSFVMEKSYGDYPYQAVIDVAYVLTDAAWYYIGEAPQLSDMVSYIRYDLVYDETSGQWLISYFTTLEGIDFTNTQAFTYE